MSQPHSPPANQRANDALSGALSGALAGRRVLIVGCGDVGQRAGHLLASRGCSVVGLRRSIATLAAPLIAVRGDVTDRASLAELAALGRFDYVVITVAAGSGGEAGYRQVYLDGLANILALLAAAPPRRILLSSSTSVYHQNDGSVVDECSATEPASYPGQVMLAAEAMLANSGMAASVIRFAGIYGPGRMRLLSRLQDGVMPACGQQISNRIHSDDCARVLLHLLDRDACGEPLAPCYLAADSAPTPLREVCQWLARRMGLDPDSLVAQDTPQRGGNKRCSNELLLSTGFQLRYPDYQAGFASLLAQD